MCTVEQGVILTEIDRNHVIICNEREYLAFAVDHLAIDSSITSVGMLLAAVQNNGRLQKSYKKQKNILQPQHVKHDPASQSLVTAAHVLVYVPTPSLSHLIFLKESTSEESERVTEKRTSLSTL